MARTRGVREGFSLAEVLVAMVVLSVGLLAMAATTGYILARIRMTGLETERVAASQQVAEWLRAQDFNDVQSRSESTPYVVGGYRFWWDVRDLGTSDYREVVVVSSGRGYDGMKWSDAAQDTFVISIFRP